MTIRVQCPVCHGIKVNPLEPEYTCDYCSGHGWFLADIGEANRTDAPVRLLKVPRDFQWELAPDVWHGESGAP